MKNLLKLFVVILAISATSTLQAQEIGIKGGANFANILVKDNDETYSDDFKSLLGFHAGVTVDFPFTDMLAFQTGALLSGKGFKVEDEDKDYDIAIKHTTSIMYIDVPLHLKATFGSDDLKIFALAGPYIGIGLSGKAKSEITFAGETEKDEEDLKFGSTEEDDLKRLDYGVSVGAGIEINQITIGATYNLGLANLAPVSENGYKINNRVFQISVGYKF